ncbi:MAG: CPBP family intramembrane metalloprotease, partial [Clostridia bacterium]|nr:CPBP family intramembrane metalloprotease [Clostridia bacterium]
AFGFALVANIFTAIFNFVLENFFDFKAITSDIGSSTTDDPFEFIFILICSAIFPALVEEFAFRGMILGSLKKFGDWPAILISSIVFAVFHGNFVQIPFAFLVGVALGIIVVISGSIWTSILAHFLINAYAVIANQFQANYSRLFFVLFYAIIVLGSICFTYLFKNGAFKLLNNRKIHLSTSSKFSLMLFSPTIIIFIAIMMFVALQYRA